MAPKKDQNSKGKTVKGKGSISHYFKRRIDQVDSDQDAVNQERESKSPRLDTEALPLGDIVPPKKEDDELERSTVPYGMEAFTLRVAGECADG